MASDDPSYEELLDENYELHEESKKIRSRLQSLEQSLVEERERARESDRRAAEIERLRKKADSLIKNVADCNREAEQHAQEQETWTRTRERLEIALREKDERLASLLRDRDGKNDGRSRDNLRRQATLERDLLEADKENEKLRAELCVLESQMAVLQGALTVTAAERDEMLTLRDRSETARENLDEKIEELQSALAGAYAEVQVVSRERDEMASAAQMASQATAQREHVARLRLETTLAENAQLRETTVASERAKAEQALSELEKERAARERLDLENVELAVLADILRQRVKELERRSHHGETKTPKGPDSSVKDIGVDLQKNRVDFRKKRDQHFLEEELAGCEAELADDRELLDIAVQESGIGAAETIRRNKQLKSTLREHEVEIEKCHSSILAQLEATSQAESARHQYKAALDDVTSSLCNATNTGKGSLHDAARTVAMCATLADKFNQLNQYCARKPAASQLQDQLTGMKLQINDLTRERSRLIGRLNETTSQISQGGVRLIGLSVDQIKQVRSYISTISCGLEQDIAKSTTTAAHVAEDQYIKPATPKPDNERVLLLEAEQGPVLLAVRRELQKIKEDGNLTQRKIFSSLCPYENVGSNDGTMPPCGPTGTSDTNQATASAALTPLCQSSPVIYGGVTSEPENGLKNTMHTNWLPEHTSANELHGAYASLTEALEALDLSERQCAELGTTVALLSGQASVMRQQVGACYDAYFKEKIHCKSLASSLCSKLAALRERRQVLDVKLENYKMHFEHHRDVLTPGGNRGCFQYSRDLAQRTASYEVNEVLLKRRHAMLDDQLKLEKDRRMDAEQALGELHAALRGRILYLEVWKHGALARVERLRSELEESVPALSAARGNMTITSLRAKQEKLVKENGALQAELCAIRRSPHYVAHAQDLTGPQRVCEVFKGDSQRNNNAHHSNSKLAQIHGNARDDAVQLASLQSAVRVANEEAAAAQRDCKRLHELVEIASLQAVEMKRLHHERMAEKAALAQCIRELEIKDEDSRIIGKLQREVIALRATFQLFARKYETARRQLKRQELGAYEQEARNDVRTESLLSIIEGKRTQLEALQRILGESGQLNMNATMDLMPCDVNELQYLREQRELELQASEQAREKLEERIEQMELHRIGGARMPVNPKLVSQPTNDTARFMPPSTEEVMSLKLRALQDMRQKILLRERVQQLETAITSQDTMLAAADYARVEAETSVLLKLRDSLITGQKESAEKQKIGDFSVLVLELQNWAEPPRSLSNRHFNANEHPSSFERNNELQKALAAAAGAKKKEEIATNHACELVRALRHYEESGVAALKFPALVRARAFVKENQITKYSLPICAMNESFERHKTIDRTQHEQRQLKNAASATILSLKTLVKEKNRELAKADERLQDVRRSSLREVDADRTKIKGLTDKSFQDHGVAIDRLRDATSGIEKTQNQAGISFRISKNEKEFAARPSDIEKTCEGLEKKLKESNAAREQAENRCSKALCELEQQKADIITLAAQLQEASSGGGGSNMLDKENQIEGKKLLNSLFKEGDRLRGLKGALVKLKTQFVAAEEAHAAALAQSACANQPNGGEKTAYLHNKIAQLTQEIQIIRSEAMATRCDIGTAWSQRDKYKQQLERTLVQVDQLRSDAHTYESRCRDLDDSLARARDECNKLRVIEEE